VAHGIRSQLPGDEARREEVAARRAARRLALALALAAIVFAPLAVCRRSGADADAQARDVDTAAMAPDAVIDAVLHECHGELQGWDRVLVQVTLPDGRRFQVRGRLPDRLRMQATDGTTWLLRDGGAYVLRDDGSYKALALGELDQARALAALCDAAALGPLHRRTAVTRSGPASFALAQPDGSEWQLELEPRKLLVARLRSPDGEVHVLGHLHRTTTWIVRKAEIAPLGACDLVFETTDLVMDDADYALSKPAPKGDHPTGTNPVEVQVGGEDQPSKPTPITGEPRHAVFLDDPGGWEQRAAAVQTALKSLEAAGQKLFGNVGFLTENGRARLFVPFKPRDGKQAYRPPAGTDVREVLGGKLLIVWPAAGSYEQRVADGERLLTAALRERRLTAAGPIFAQPLLHLDEGVPPADKLAAPKVRVAVAVR
jgi:hypothetical protein